MKAKLAPAKCRMFCSSAPIPSSTWEGTGQPALFYGVEELISEKSISLQCLVSETGLCFVIFSDHLDEHSSCVFQFQKTDFHCQI